MRTARSVVALAIILATTVSYGPSVYADDSVHTSTSTTPQSSVATTSSEPPKPSTIAVTVQAGDTLSTIAASHETTVEAIIAANAIANPNIIEPGQVLQIPGSSQALGSFSDSLRAAAMAFMAPPPPAPIQPVPIVVAPVAARYASSSGNTYTWGTCTWYVKSRIASLPNQLGNGGYGWLSHAAGFGYATGTTPAPGAIGVESGHVVIVESVNDNGTVNISEMNYAGGVGVIHYRTTSASEFQYIYV